MNYAELATFKKFIHNPTLEKAFERTELKEGYKVIDFMQISYLDCSNCGFDTRMYVSGLQFVDGRVSKYECEMLDATIKDLFQEIKEIPFMFDSKVIIEDQLKPITLETELYATNNCVLLFPEVADITPCQRLIQNMEYEKMKFLYSEEQAQEEMEMGGMQM